MDYKQNYERLRKFITDLYPHLSDYCKEKVEGFLPELKEIRRGDTREDLISFLDELSKLGRGTNFDRWTAVDCAKWIDWVTKQDSTWFEKELEKAYKCADEVQYRKGYADAKRDIEKQNTLSRLTEEEQRIVTDGLLRKCALNFVEYLDAHRYEGKMCVSNGECKDIEDAFSKATWDKLHRYYCKYIEKQGEQNEDATKDKVVKYLSNLISDQALRGAPMLSFEDECRIEKEADLIIRISKNELKNEKQDEQNPTKKDESEFHIEKGNWYVCKRDLDDNYGTRAFREGNVYYSEKDETLMSDNSNVPFEMKYCVEYYFRLWTIEDAKEGDVLTCNSKKHGQEIGIVKKYIGKRGGCDTCFDTYCLIDWDGVFRVDESMGCPNIYPANGEQRKLLFQKMKDEGYKWDDDKKELKKIGQKQKKSLKNRDSFIKDLETLMNQYGIDTFTETNDFILADFLWRIIEQLENLNDKKKWWSGKSIQNGGEIEEPLTEM